MQGGSGKHQGNKNKDDYGDDKRMSERFEKILSAVPKRGDMVQVLDLGSKWVHTFGSNLLLLIHYFSWILMKMVESIEHVYCLYMT